MKHIFYNPLANNGKGKQAAEELAAELGKDAFKVDVRNINVLQYLDRLSEEDEVFLVGGDGTLNCFCNTVKNKPLKNNVWLCKGGSGNDFLHDMEAYCQNGKVLLNEWIKDLPTVTVNGKERVFINGVGYGIDGYCCEVGDAIREKNPGAKINYAGIAIKGLLFKYKPFNATVVVDGKEYSYRKVWLAPTMKGRYYGGGMKVAPSQDRKNPERTLTNVVIRGGKLPVLILFPGIFKGEHIKKKKNVFLTEGKEITVKFDRPTAIQIDGETILNVTEYSVRV